MMTRSSGVLAHISSLPSPHGIGTLGRAAFDFVDFLKAARQTYWQVLPLGHTGFGNSPYQCFSAAAGNPNLIDLDLLVEDGLLTADEIDRAITVETQDTVDYAVIEVQRPPLLQLAFSRISPEMKTKIRAFSKKNADWLPDYALFMTLKEEKFDNRPVWEWSDRALRDRVPEALAAASAALQEKILYHEFLQYEFFTQWNALHAYAKKSGIRIIGDIPIYVAPDSVDVWCNPLLFKLHADLSPKKVAGVPPDYYSVTGQLWGNPVYDWKQHEATGYDWWIWRIRANLRLFDIIRIDHFRGFESYWEVSAGMPTAEKGKWIKGPNMALFHAAQKVLGDLPVIAEDLGVITPAVRKLLDESGFPGMRVLIFGFDAHSDNEHLPHNYVPNSIVYTSTHDSQSVCEQVMDLCTEEEKQFAYRYLRSSPSEPLGRSGICAVWASSARVAMTTLPDLLSLGADSRMNVPSTIGGNWRWRVRREGLNADMAAVLGEITETFKRANNVE